MLKNFHLPVTRSVRPIWLFYELGLQVDVHHTNYGLLLATKVNVLPDSDVPTTR